LPCAAARVLSFTKNSKPLGRQVGVSLHDWKFHCAVLGVPEHSSLKEIKDAYRKLAQRYHPDHNGGTLQAKERFQQISTAYRYLSRNAASRPVLQSTEVFTPPPPHPAYARERAGSGNKAKAPAHWAMKALKFLKNNGAAFVSGVARNKQLQAPLLIGGLLIVGTLTLSTIFRNVNVEPPAAEPPKFTSLEVSPDSKVDSFGRPKGRCEFASFSNGRLIARTINDLSENDCSLGCYSWVEKYKENDAGCDWEGTTLVQHNAPLHDRLPATPSTNVTNRETNEAAPIFYFNRIPDGDGKTPTEWRETRVGEEIVLEWPYVPTVWIEDKKLMLARKGLHSNQVVFTPIRPGATGVFVADSEGRRIRKFVYDIK